MPSRRFTAPPQRPPHTDDSEVMHDGEPANYGVN